METKARDIESRHHRYLDSLYRKADGDESYFDTWIIKERVSHQVCIQWGETLFYILVRIKDDEVVLYSGGWDEVKPLMLALTPKSAHIKKRLARKKQKASVTTKPTTEEDCFTPSEDADTCADCGQPVYYCDAHGWEHTSKEHECFMNRSSCKDV